MGYFGIGLVVTVITFMVLTFFIIVYLKEIMEHMKSEGYGYTSGGSYIRGVDVRGTWLTVASLIIIIVTTLIWPIILAVEFVGILYFFVRKEDKLKRIIKIMKEKDTGDLEK